MKNFLIKFSEFINKYAIWLAGFQILTVAFCLIIGEKTMPIYNVVFLSVIWFMMEFEKKCLLARIELLENDLGR